MNSTFPYQKLLRDRATSEWEVFKRIHFQLQEKTKRRKSIAEEIFAIKIVLDEQWKKWFVIATNHSRTNDQSKGKVIILWEIILMKFKDHEKNKLFTQSGFWKRNTVKIFLQTFNLDFFFYGDSLRTNFEREEFFKTFLEAFRRNLALSVTNNLLFYGVPILLITIHPIFVAVLLFSALSQFFFSYQRTIKFYYLNEINKIISQPHN